MEWDLESKLEAMKQDKNRRKTKEEQAKSDEKNRKEKKEFHKLLEEAYGMETKDGGANYISRQNITLSKIAEELGYDNSQFSKMLKPVYNTASNRSYQSIIASLKLKIQLIEKEKKIKALELQVSQLEKKSSSPFANRTFLFFMILFGLFLSFFLFSYFKPPKETELSHFGNIANYGQFRNIQMLNGMRILAQLTQEGKDVKSQIEKQLVRDTLTDIIKINSIEELQTDIIKIIGTSRGFIKDLDFRVQGKRNMADFIEHLYPIDSLFYCTAKELALSKKLPECAKDSPYDKVLFELRKHLFSKEDVNLDDKIQSLSVRIQNVQAVEVEKLFMCYLEKGESCFEADLE